MAKKLVYGVGFNDSKVTVKPVIDGVQTECPFYRAWRNMLMRCYDAEFHKKRPNYLNCTVCEEWLTFSNFKAWMKKQDWEGKQLDKDLLFCGNKVYSPDTCIFISGRINSFMNDRSADRGALPIGVDLIKKSGAFRARCSNPYTGHLEHIGYFDCPNKAHEAWRIRKYRLALSLCDNEKDERVSSALLARYGTGRSC